jgi:CRP/FNR family transcriptional regulator, cyclic AMP receptor protein
MAGDSILKFFNSVPFFKAFSDVEKMKFTNIKDCYQQYNKKDVIFKQGDPGSVLFLVLQGEVALTRLGTIKADKGRVSLKDEVDSQIAILKPGTIFGEISMLTESKRNVTAQVFSEKLVVMKVTKGLIDSLNHPTQIKFHKQLLLALATHLDSMNAQFVDLQYKYDQGIKSNE